MKHAWPGRELRQAVWTAEGDWLDMVYTAVGVSDAGEMLADYEGHVVREAAR